LIIKLYYLIIYVYHSDKVITTKMQGGALMPNATIMYYTGTGNTARAAHLLCNDLSGFGYKVNMIHVRRNTPPPSSCGDLAIVLFPVLAFTIPQSLRFFLNHLPKGNGCKAAIVANHGMLDTKGGFSKGHESQSPLVIKRILSKKNYIVTYLDAVGYPENLTFIASAIPKTDEEAVLQAGDTRVREIAKNISSGVIVQKTYRLANRISGWLVGALFTWLGRWHFGKCYVANSTCNGCGLCAKGCPSRTIRMVRGKPMWGYGCDGCLFCYNACPSSSIQVSIVRLIALSVAEILPIVLAASYGGSIVTGVAGSDVSSFISGNPLLSIISGLIVFGVFVVPLVFATDKLLAFLERIPFLGPLMNITYTRNLKRYLCPGFKPLKKEQGEV
jgi:Pyruvate/2-oxoacid:ferredoxin oxidoreductase delta subunit